MSSEPVRVVLIDDDALVRAGLRLILGGGPGLDIVAEGSDGSEAARLVAEHRPHVVLMDIRMPTMDGLEATQRLLQDPQAPRVIILTTFDADELVLKALAVGASGFLLKDTPPERMVEAVRQVAAGEHTLSPTIVAQVIAVATRGVGSSRKAEALRALEALTEREREIAVAIGQGLTNGDIASSHYMSLATVKAHVTKILDKLGATNRVQIAIQVHDAEWV